MTELDADVVVIGSGCTGGWACKVLAEAGHSVVLLEAGRAITRADYPAQWYRQGDRSLPADTTRQFVQKNHPAYCAANRSLWIDDVDNPYLTDADNPFVWIRSRVTGGRSNLWGGQCWRLTPHELQAPAQDGIGEPWPLDYADLATHYDTVESFIGINGRNDPGVEMPQQQVNGQVQLTRAELRMDQRLRESWQYPATAARSASDSEHAYADSGSWPRFSSLGSTLPAALATGRLHIVNEAIVARLDADASGRRVHAAVYIDAASGAEKRVRARAFLLCASTIESTRILLNSTDSRHPQGLGNSSGVLGRYLMDHIGTALIGQVEDADDGAEGTFFGGRHGLYLPRLRDTAATPRFVRSYGCWLSLGRPMGHGHNAIINAIGEMLPYADNRVTLEPRRVDRWGLPLVRIDCRVQDNEIEMRKHQQRTLAELAELAQMRIAIGPSSAALGALVHEVGTARMGSDPRSSYCNSVAQSWDVPNVFVPDGACWPTSAYQNPTLTMMALASRCGHYVSAQLARSRR